MDAKQPRSREQQIEEQGFVDHEELMAYEATVHAKEGAPAPPPAPPQKIAGQ